MKTGTLQVQVFTAQEALPVEGATVTVTPLSTTFRLLKVLQAADFVYQDSQLGWWHIGLGVFNVGAAYIHNRDVLSVAGPFKRRLMLLSGETVNDAIRNGNEAVLIGQLECKSMVRMCAPLGSRLPLHASGAGKALLYPLVTFGSMSVLCYLAFIYRGRRNCRES